MGGLAASRLKLGPEGVVPPEKRLERRGRMNRRRSGRSEERVWVRLGAGSEPAGWAVRGR